MVWPAEGEVSAEYSLRAYVAAFSGPRGSQCSIYRVPRMLGSRAMCLPDMVFGPVIMGRVC